MTSKTINPTKEIRRQSPSPSMPPRSFSLGTHRNLLSISTESDSISLNDDTSSVKSESRAMTPKMEVEHRLQMKKKLEEEQYTFRPKVNTSDFPSPERGSGVTRFETLYLDAKKRKEQNNERVVAASIDKELTFQPTLSTNSSISPLEGIPPSKAVNVAEVVERLYKPEVIKMKKELEAKKLEEELKPKITKKAQNIDRSAIPDIGDRLFKQAAVQRENLEKLKVSEEAKLSTVNTFSPRLSTLSRSLSASHISKVNLDEQLPIEERLKKYEELKVKKIEAVAEELRKKEAESTTFKPVINPSSKRFATPTRTGDLFERLSKPIDKEGLAAKHLAELEASLFQPQLLTKRSASVSNVSTGGPTVHDRLFKEADLNRQKLDKERELREAELLKGATFSPQINSRAEELPPDKGVFERLATNKHYVHEVLRQLKEDMELAKCTFKPTINRRPSSVESEEESLHSSSTVHLRLLAEGARMRADQEKAKKQILAQQEKELTFRPTIGTSGYKLKREIPSDQPVHLRLNAEAERLREEHKRRVEEAAAEKERQLSVFAQPKISSKSRKGKGYESDESQSMGTPRYENLTASVSYSRVKEDPRTNRQATPTKLSARQQRAFEKLSAGKHVSDFDETKSAVSDLDFDDIYHLSSPRGAKMPQAMPASSAVSPTAPITNDEDKDADSPASRSGTKSPGIGIGISPPTAAMMLKRPSQILMVKRGSMASNVGAPILADTSALMANLHHDSSNPDHPLFPVDKLDDVDGYTVESDIPPPTKPSKISPKRGNKSLVKQNSTSSPKDVNTKMPPQSSNPPKLKSRSSSASKLAGVLSSDKTPFLSRSSVADDASHASSSLMAGVKAALKAVAAAGRRHILGDDAASIVSELSESSVKPRSQSASGIKRKENGKSITSARRASPLPKSPSKPIKSTDKQHSNGNEGTDLNSPLQAEQTVTKKKSSSPTRGAVVKRNTTTTTSPNVLTVAASLKSPGTTQKGAISAEELFKKAGSRTAVTSSSKTPKTSSSAQHAKPPPSPGSDPKAKVVKRKPKVLDSSPLVSQQQIVAEPQPEPVDLYLSSNEPSVATPLVSDVPESADISPILEQSPVKESSLDYFLDATSPRRALPKHLAEKGGFDSDLESVDTMGNISVESMSFAKSATKKDGNIVTSNATWKHTIDYDESDSESVLSDLAGIRITENFARPPAQSAAANLFPRDMGSPTVVAVNQNNANDVSMSVDELLSDDGALIMDSRESPTNEHHASLSAAFLTGDITVDNEQPQSSEPVIYNNKISEVDLSVKQPVEIKSVESDVLVSENDQFESSPFFSIPSGIIEAVLPPSPRPVLQASQNPQVSSNNDSTPTMSLPSQKDIPSEAPELATVTEDNEPAKSSTPSSFPINTEAPEESESTSMDSESISTKSTSMLHPLPNNITTAPEESDSSAIIDQSSATKPSLPPPLPDQKSFERADSTSSNAGVTPVKPTLPPPLPSQKSLIERTGSSSSNGGVTPVKPTLPPPLPKEYTASFTRSESTSSIVKNSPFRNNSNNNPSSPSNGDEALPPYPQADTVSSIVKNSPFRNSSPVSSKNNDDALTYPQADPNSSIVKNSPFRRASVNSKFIPVPKPVESVTPLNKVLRGGGKIGSDSSISSSPVPPSTE